MKTKGGITTITTFGPLQNRIALRGLNRRFKSTIQKLGIFLPLLFQQCFAGIRKDGNKELENHLFKN